MEEGGYVQRDMEGGCEGEVGALDRAIPTLQSEVILNSARRASKSNSPTVEWCLDAGQAPHTRRRKLRHQATSLTGDLRADLYDEDLLRRAVADAGRWAYGTILVEVWLLTQDELALILAHSGWWIDPVYHRTYHPPQTAKGIKTEDPAAKVSLFTRLSSNSLPSYKASLPQHRQQERPTKTRSSCPVCRLIDNERQDYLDPAPMVPGEGLPGALWMADSYPEFANPSMGGRSRGSWGSRSGTGRSRFLFPKIQQKYQGNDNDETVEQNSSEPFQDAFHNPTARVNPPDSHDHDVHQTLPSPREGASWGSGRRAYLQNAHPIQSKQTRVVWRNINALANDPDQPWNPRLQHMAAMGLGWAAAVPIRHEGERKGIVIYMARAGVDLVRLQDPANEAYLSYASNLIAASLIVRTYRHEAIRERREEANAALRRVRRRIQDAIALGLSLEELVEKNLANRKEELTGGYVPPRDESLEKQSSCLGALFHGLIHLVSTGRKKMGMTLRKCAGSNVKPPPTFTWQESLHTFLAVFATLLIITNLNRSLIRRDGTNAAIVLAPIGALVTLVYGLTAAPASQPLNIFLGQILSVSLAIVLNYVPQSFWTNEIKISLTTALAIALMTKLGLTHPPAGAAALAFSANASYIWSNMGTFLLGNLIVVIAAAFLNNLSAKRQYPTSWGIGFLLDQVKTCLESFKH